MDLSFLDKFFLVEDTRINIIANIVFKNVKDNIDKDALKYINYFYMKFFNAGNVTIIIGLLMVFYAFYSYYSH